MIIKAHSQMDAAVGWTSSSASAAISAVGVFMDAAAVMLAAIPMNSDRKETTMRTKRQMRTLAVVIVACGVVLWGEALAGAITDDINPHRPKPPRPAVEANRLDESARVTADAGMGDGPTPFPRPSPPKPKPTDPYTIEQTADLEREAFIRSMSSVSADRSIPAWSDNATWWTRRESDGALIFHDCLARAQEKTADAAPELAILVVGMQTYLSSNLTGALAPWKEAFRTAIAQEEEADALATNGDAAPLPIAEINQRWQRLVAIHAEEIAETAALGAPASGATCTTGRCDCKACPKKHTCDCQYYRPGMEDCSTLQRDNCNVDTPPDPRSGGAPVLDTRGGY